MKHKLKVGDKLPNGYVGYEVVYNESLVFDGSLRLCDKVVHRIDSYRGIDCYFIEKKHYVGELYYLVKISEVDKLIKDETMKTYRSFAISGTKSLLRAMEEELNLLGYVSLGSSFIKGTEYTNGSHEVILSSDYSTITKKEKVKELYSGNVKPITSFNVHFQLPSQWDECLVFCKGQLEPELKVGDWIYFLKSFDGKSKGYITQVGNIKEEGVAGSAGWVTYRNGGFRLRGTGNGYTINVDFRLATKEEIEKATSITVGEYKMEITNGKAKFGCQYITKEEVTTLRKFLGEPYHAKISLHNTEITTDLLNKILDRL